jgi:hypothetical protein
MFYATLLPLAAFVAIAVPVQFLGTISGAINIGNMIGPMLLQPGIGRILDRRWSGQLANGLRVYGVACVLISLTRETYCKPIV